ncbi:MAG: ABC transporter permease subunit [Bacillota bacterium]
MNMLLHELKVYRKTLIIWTLTISGIMIMYISFFPAFSQNIDAAKQLITNIPPIAKLMLGLQLESFKNINSYYSFVFSIVQIFAGIQALNLGLSLISKEFRWKTVDFLFSRPVSRISIMTSKLTAALISITITNVFVTLVSLAMIRLTITSEYNLFSIFLISLTMFFIQLVFVSLGVAITVFFTKIKVVVLLSVGIVMGMFALNMLDKATGNAAIWYLIPFRFFDLTQINTNKSFEPISLIWTFVVIICLIVFSYIFYKRKDIHTV